MISIFLKIFSDNVCIYLKDISWLGWKEKERTFISFYMETFTINSLNSTHLESKKIGKKTLRIVWVLQTKNFFKALQGVPSSIYV